MICENTSCHYAGPRGVIYIHDSKLLCEYCAPSNQKEMIEDCDLYYVNNTGKDESDPSFRYRHLEQIDIKNLIFIVSES
jgi:hypothetical protein